MEYLSDTGILKTWPEAGPKELWRMPLGNGFSGISIANGRAYTMFAEGEDEVVVCLDAETGAELWRYLDDWFTQSVRAETGRAQHRRLMAIPFMS